MSARAINRHPIVVLATLALSASAVAQQGAGVPMSHTYRNPTALETVQWLPRAVADHRIRYGDDSLKFGDLRLPASPAQGRFPVVVVIHGGGWKAGWTLDHTARMAEALTAIGIATWNVEFWRLNNPGGGWPGTFLSLANATDHVRKLAAQYPLDLDRVVALGHSSGGHLALWLGARKRLPGGSPLHTPQPLALRGVVSLAGLPDLQGALEQGKRTDILDLLQVPDAQQAMPRLAQASPKSLLPLGTRQSLIVGTRDDAWRVGTTRRYAEQAAAAGDAVRLEVLEGANHFDVIDTCGPAWPVIVREVLTLLGDSPKEGDRRLALAQDCARGSGR
jgi:acetyl esterase/lipase